MKTITNLELKELLEYSVSDFSNQLAGVLKKQPNLGFITETDPENSELFASRLLFRLTENLLTDHLKEITQLPPGNYLLYYIKARDYFGFAYTIQGLVLNGTIDRSHLRSLLADCLRYLRLELKRCDGHEKRYLGAFVLFIRNRGANDLFFPKDAKIQTEYPLPETVKVVNFDNPTSGQTISMEAFLTLIKSVKDIKHF